MGDTTMATTDDLSRRRRPVAQERPPEARVARSLLTLGSLVIAALVVMMQDQYRRGETVVAALLMRWVLASDATVVPGTTLIIFDRGRDSQFAVRLVAGCSTSLILVPLALFVAALAASGRVWPRRLLLAGCVAAAIVYLGNMVRFLAIVVSVRTIGGWRGFGWGHTTIGSTIVLFAIVAAGLVFYRMIRERPGDLAGEEVAA